MLSYSRHLVLHIAVCSLLVFPALQTSLVTAHAQTNHAGSSSGKASGAVAFDSQASVNSQAILSPRAVLGFTPGDDRTIADWSQINNYFARLDKASERVRVEQIGLTTLKRPLIVAFISAPENIRELEKYKIIQRRLSDPRTVASETARDELIRQGKTVIAISCSIHSTEIVASQMSMQLAYELATAEDAATREILQNTILLLIPSANPDGVDIVADWYRKTLGTPYEGTEPPEIYHYYAGHDDNRDWFMLDLAETRAITKFFWKEWFPEIVYDVHQQGATGSRFFIPPFYDPPNPRIAPLLLREVGLIGHKMAADLEAANVQGVITNALYDTWWHGGFRTAPYYHNSIGILSEAASARIMTPVTVTREQLAKSTTRGMISALSPATNFPNPWTGGVWRPRDIMNIELIASRSLLSLAAKYRTDYLRNFYELNRRAVASHASTDNSPLAYLIPAGQGRDENVAKLIGALVGQGMEVYRLDRELHLSFANQPNGGATETPLGSYIVFLSQPQRANVQSLFEAQQYPTRRTATGDAERPYDVAGWTLPLQMGVEARAVTSIRETAADRRLTLLRDEQQVRRDLALPLQANNSAAATVASPIKNPITRPVRLALYKSYTGSMDEGWTRYVFDTFNVPYKSVFNNDMRAGNLRARFDVIVLPSQTEREIIEGNAAGKYPAELTGGIGEAGVQGLREFVEAGGTLVCFDASTELAIKRFNLPLRNVLEGVRSSEFYCPGSILKLNVDTQQTLARGFERDTNAYFINSQAFEINKEATDAARVRVIARYAETNVLQSGWLLGESYIKNKIALAEVTMGKGRIVLFGFRPQHRGQTWGTFPFIFNAIQGERSRESE
ncbi:MAG: M14 family metallopeptidase [Pyrinomonadaceae bacterium]